MPANQENQVQQIASNNSDNSEQILVVKRKKLFSDDHVSWNGLNKQAIKNCLQVITTHQEFHSRDHMEYNLNYKQIIPYMIFKYCNRYFLMQRSSNASEKRMQSKYSLGIGGHVRKEDLDQGPDIFDWAKREFYEEISYKGNLKIKPLGVLNDDSTEVGKVHLGLALLLEGDSDTIAIKSEFQSGILVTFDTLLARLDQMEEWSKMIVKTL